MKRVLLGGLVLAILLAGCIVVTEAHIVVRIPADYVDLIYKVVVTVYGAGKTAQLETTVISEEITFNYTLDGTEELITVAAYDEDGNLLLTGKTEYNGEANVYIDLEFAGVGTATHIIILQDVLPWSTTAMTDMLEAEGFSEGTGEYEYEIVTSSEFYLLDPNPITDLVIVANDQTQEFYDSLALYDDVINEFAYYGGVLLWEVCDNGWNGGDITLASIELPAGIDINLQYEYNNAVAMPEHPLFEGLSDTIAGNYASHEYFTNLPEGTLVLMNGTDSNSPTLVIYPYGAGIVFMTGQPLEHGYAYGYDIGELLPRLVKLILGRDITKTAPHNVAKVEIPSVK